ncbi:MAG: hypothetical protein KHX91_01995 [Clostridium sp.]|jgi:hypothetical protein|nr:hypothetical protein [Clostridium sp.]
MSENIVNPIFADAHRIFLVENAINIQFGLSDKDGEDKEPEVIGNVFVTPELALQLAGSILMACTEYQDKYKHDLGLKLDIKTDSGEK